MGENNSKKKKKVTHCLVELGHFLVLHFRSEELQRYDPVPSIQLLSPFDFITIWEN